MQAGRLHHKVESLAELANPEKVTIRLRMGPGIGNRHGKWGGRGIEIASINPGGAKWSVE